MPGFNRTGPQGFGPMTGRGRGLCAGFAKPFGFGRGRALRGGRGLGRGPAGQYDWQFGETTGEDARLLTPEEERRLLKADRNRLKAQLAQTEERLREIGREVKSETDDKGGAPDSD